MPSADGSELDHRREGIQNRGGEEPRRVTLTTRSPPRQTVNVEPAVMVTKPAILDFVGSWMCRTNARVPQRDQELARQPVGQPCPPALGRERRLVYFADANGTRAVLNLRGRHVFRAAGEVRPAD